MAGFSGLRCCSAQNDKEDYYSFHVGGPHARGKPRTQDDGRKRRERVRIYTFTPMLAVVTRYTCYSMFPTLEELRGD